MLQTSFDIMCHCLCKYIYVHAQNLNVMSSFIDSVDGRIRHAIHKYTLWSVFCPNVHSQQYSQHMLKLRDADLSTLSIHMSPFVLYLVWIVFSKIYYSWWIFYFLVHWCMWCKNSYSSWVKYVYHTKVRQRYLQYYDIVHTWLITPPWRTKLYPLITCLVYRCND